LSWGNSATTVLHNLQTALWYISPPATRMHSIHTCPNVSFH
ncbi:hypothetical protein T4A_4606, partial [Trichinella pseudospiralis]